MTGGHSGIGTVTHMTLEKFRLRAGVQITPVAYKGGATPVIALLGGEITMLMATAPASSWIDRCVQRTTQIGGASPERDEAG